MKLIKYKEACVVILALLLVKPAFSQQEKAATFCNPLNLPYNFQTKDGAVRREAADPVIVRYLDQYWLFASKQAGYWYSKDLINWNFVRPTGLPLDVYAPSVTVVDGKLCYTSGNANGTFTTDDPFTGTWTNISRFQPGANDPAVFQDEDGKVYLYDGCHDKRPLKVTELDRKKFTPLAEGIPTIYSDIAHHGWEVTGEENLGRKQGDSLDKNARPWIEGSFMNKINGKYYLQYAAPGTQVKVYADGVYISDKPQGPFTYAPYSPFSFKPTGFIAGAGHSCTFRDAAGRYWHIATGTISIRHSFERRLVLFPTGVLKDGQLVTNTYLGDYPQRVPLKQGSDFLDNLAGWMLLSYRKPATASSVLDGNGSGTFKVNNAFDEDIRTWWSAKSGGSNEWLQVDLLKNCTIHAIQVNFADQDCKVGQQVYTDSYRYIIESSVDGKLWTKIIDRSNEKRDMPHDYTELPKPVKARYVRISNLHYPAEGLFSIYDLRVFGKAPGKLPARPGGITVKRDTADARCAHIKWEPVPDADFYIVRYGIDPDRLFGNYQAYDGTSLSIHSLNTDVGYYFTVDAVNACGITKGARPIEKYAAPAK